MRKAIHLLALLAWTSACAAPQPERAALEAAAQRWTAAVAAQDVTALNALMAPDVQLLIDTATVQGRDAAVGALRDVAARGKLATTTREITIGDRFAWRVAALTQTRKNGDVHALGQSLEIWKREARGWTLHRWMATGLGTPHATLSRPPPDEPVLDRPRLDRPVP